MSIGYMYKWLKNCTIRKERERERRRRRKEERNV
jgi:hypothetical protein